MRTVPEPLEHPYPAWNYVLRSAGPCLVSVIGFGFARVLSRCATSFRELPPEPEKSWSYTEYTPVLIYAAAALVLFLSVFLRGSHKVFCLGLVNGAVFAACCCLRDAPRKKSYTYHLSQP